MLNLDIKKGTAEGGSSQILQRSKDSSNRLQEDSSQSNTDRLSSNTTPTPPHDVYEPAEEFSPTQFKRKLESISSNFRKHMEEPNSVK